MKSCPTVKAITCIQGTAKYPIFHPISCPQAGRHCSYINQIGLEIRAEVFSSEPNHHSGFPSSQDFMRKITMINLCPWRVSHSQKTMKEEGLTMSWRMSDGSRDISSSGRSKEAGWWTDEHQQTEAKRPSMGLVC